MKIKEKANVNCQARIAKTKQRRMKQNSGITLIALVVTIVVLIILSTVSISAVFSENGIIRKAELARDYQANATKADEEALDTLLEEYNNAMAEPPAPLDPESLNKGPNGKPLATEVTKTYHNTIIAEDTLGNQVVVPGGFKIAEESGETVKEGIVVEDESGNQFVWIPVSNINHDGSNKIKIDETNEVEITLGRYTFDLGTKDSTTYLYNGTGAVSTTAGTYQYAVNYANTVTLGDYFQELSTFRESDQTYSGTNATAKDLGGFVSSVSTNKGYYIGRYEASYESGSEFGVGNSRAYYKPATKESTTASRSSWTPSESTVGYLWNRITQGNASKACRQMYYGNSYVESDLVNSYAWDTAIVYIQEMDNSGYACANKVSTGNTSLRNTGTTSVEGEILDEKCKIFDMASNTSEWTTEYSTRTYTTNETHCTRRGGYYNGSDYCTGLRNDQGGLANGPDLSFRPLVYISNPES